MAYNQQKQKLDEMGALWKKTAKSGNTFISGVINLKNIGGEDKDIAVLVFKNTFKEPGTSGPDFRIYLAPDLPAKSTPAKKPFVKRAAPAQRPQTQQDEEQEQSQNNGSSQEEFI